ncbi:hypothetical protein YWIDRAFT_05640 [Streptomyces sp. SceaMP-e96]|nr:hypothetical protein YWIDRAFT_05640 [Streptomyces sp. SceaMP-e96]
MPEAAHFAFVDAKTATIYQAALRLAATHIWTAR